MQALRDTIKRVFATTIFFHRTNSYMSYNFAYDTFCHIDTFPLSKCSLNAQAVGARRSLNQAI